MLSVLRFSLIFILLYAPNMLYAQIDQIDVNLVELWLDDVLVAKQGMLSSSYSEDQGAKVLAKEEFTVRICLGRGESSAEIWTTDLSYDYIKINAEYRT